MTDFRGNQKGIAIGLFIVSVALAGIGIAFVSAAQHASSRARFAAEWPSVTGTIRQASLQENGAPEVLYVFNAGGKSQEGRRIFLSEGPYEAVKTAPGGISISYRSPEDQSLQILELREGSAVPVFHNPHEPADAVLKPELLGSMRKFMFIGIAAVVFAMFAGARSFFYE